MRFNGNWRDVKRFALADESRNYTRNLISIDHETYALILIVWNPGKYSPIHDHPCDGCWVHVIAGAVNEVRYSRHDNRLVEIGNATLTRGATTYMEDSIGLHKIGNPSSDAPAVTLHLYSRPTTSAASGLTRRTPPSAPRRTRATSPSTASAPTTNSQLKATALAPSPLSC